MESLFADATRQKIRFETAQGCLTVEDLWDLPLTSTRRVHLDGIAIGLYQELQAQQVSFVEEVSKANTLLTLKFDVVKHIIAVKKADKLAAAQDADKAARKAKLLDILAHKQDAALEALSIEELQGMVGAL